MSDLNELQNLVVQFRDERNWKQFHTPKDQAIGIMLEAAEFAEHFRWKTESEMKEYIKNNKKEIAEEVVDVLYWVLLIAHDFNIDLATTFKAKMIKNIAKYPLEKFKGDNKKVLE